MKIEIFNVRILEEEDVCNPGYLDDERRKAYEEGEFSFIGILAQANVGYRLATEYGCECKLETFASGGLWGIESDSDQDYLNSVAEEELADLKAHLEAFGIDTSRWEELTEDCIKDFEKWC